MIKYVLIAAACLFIATGAHAQTQASTTGTVDAKVQGQFNSNVVIDQRGGSVPTDTTIRAAPTVYAPSVIGGNPCSVGMSAAGSVIGFGAAVGATWADKECAQRQRVALLFNMGERDAAKELACNDEETYHAYRMAGKPCTFRSSFEPKGAAPVVVAAPVPASPVPVVEVKQYQKCSSTVKDNCVGN